MSDLDDLSATSFFALWGWALLIAVVFLVVGCELGSCQGSLAGIDHRYKDCAADYNICIANKDKVHK